VRVSPPPHPGIAHEQSIKAGPGENGGMEMLDGPTFAATEGWDWIPGIRDRNTGIWQDVTLTATGARWKWATCKWSPRCPSPIAAKRTSRSRRR
jgi:hypothetical protein